MARPIGGGEFAKGESIHKPYEGDCVVRQGVKGVLSSRIQFTKAILIALAR